MRRQGLIGFAAGIVAAVSVAVVVAAVAAPSPTTSPSPAGTAAPVGRFQLAHLGSYANGDSCWIIDTTNGHVWTHFSSGTWNDQGTPPSGAK